MLELLERISFPFVEFCDAILQKLSSSVFTPKITHINWKGNIRKMLFISLFDVYCYF